MAALNREFGNNLMSHPVAPTKTSLGVRRAPRERNGRHGGGVMATAPWSYALLLQDFRAVRMFLRDLGTLTYGVAQVLSGECLKI